MKPVSSHYNDSASTSAAQYDPENLWTLEDYPANYFRLDLLLHALQAAGTRSLFEFGVGDASPLVSVASKGIRVSGFDFAPEMVAHAKNNFVKNGLDPGNIVLADAQEASTLDPVLARFGQFEAVMALGVIPHISNDADFIRQMSNFLLPGGRLFISFRNSLFSLFTLNRITKEFILGELLSGVAPEIRKVVEYELDNRLATDKPTPRTGGHGVTGYDEIVARFHNPFNLAEIVEQQGFGKIKYHWYHYHPAPPILAQKIGALEFRRAAFDLENEGSWRGMFLCSAGMIEAVKDSF